MKKFSQRFFIATGIILSVLLVLAIIAYLLVDAEAIKQRLSTELAAQTGQHLNIDGDVNLSLFPTLAVQLNKVALRSEGKKQSWLKVDRIAGELDFMRLITGELVINSFTIDKPQINLIAAHFPKDTATPAKTSKQTKAKDPETGTPLLIGIRKIKVSNGTLNWGRTAKDGQLDITKLSAYNSAPGKPVTFKFDTVVHSPEVPRAVPVSGSMVIDFSKPDRLKIAPIDIALDKSTINGSLGINTRAATRITFDLVMDTLNVDRYTGPASKAKATADNKTVKTSTAKTRSKTQSKPSNTIISGKLALKKLYVAGLDISNTQTRLRFANDVLTLSRFKSGISGGQLKGDVVVDLKGTQPVIKLNQKLSKVQVGRLLKDLKIYDHFSGKGDIALALNMRGNDVDPLLKSLNGKVSFNLAESSFNDADLLATAKKLENYYRLAKGKPLEEPVTSKKAYDVVKGSFVWKCNTWL
jgi:AsmA protein